MTMPLAYCASLIRNSFESLRLTLYKKEKQPHENNFCYFSEFGKIDVLERTMIFLRDYFDLEIGILEVKVNKFRDIFL